MPTPQIVKYLLNAPPKKNISHNPLKKIVITLTPKRINNIHIPLNVNKHDPPKREFVNCLVRHLGSNGGKKVFKLKRKSIFESERVVIF